MNIWSESQSNEIYLKIVIKLQCLYYTKLFLQQPYFHLAKPRGSGQPQFLKHCLILFCSMTVAMLNSTG